MNELDAAKCGLEKASEPERDTPLDALRPSAQPPLIKKRGRRKLALAAGVLALLVALVWFGVVGRESGVSVYAVTADETGVAPDTAFRITLPREVTAQELRGLIEMQPPYPFVLREAGEPGVYELRLVAPMDKYSNVSIFVDGEEFPFTVRNELLVTRVFPRPDATGVPVDTMITLTLNSGGHFGTPALQDSISLVEAGSGESMEFTVRQQGSELHISPLLPLWLETTYTLTLSPPLINAEDASLLRPFSLTFTTRELPPPRNFFSINGGERSINILAGEVPVLQAFISGYITGQAPYAAITLRAFGGWESFYAALGDEDFDAGQLPVAAEFQLEPFELPEGTASWWEEDSFRLLVFPRELPAGWYHVEVTVGCDNQEAGSATRQVLLQVSEISAFYMITGTDILVWVHDTLTGEPISGAQVSFSHQMTATGQTDNRGVALILNAQVTEPGEGSRSSVSTRFTVSTGGRVFVADDSIFERTTRTDHWGGASRRYIGYIYTDRVIYRTTDTIQVWGVVRPRDFASPIPAGLELYLRDSRIAQPVTLLPDGTFTATIELEGVAPTRWGDSLTLRTAEGIYLSNRVSLSIGDFATPDFTASATPDAPVFLLDEDRTVSATINVDNEQFLQIDPATAPLVLETFKRYAEGDTIVKLVEWLNDKGVNRTASAGSD